MKQEPFFRKAIDQVHIQNIDLQNVESQNVDLQNVESQNVNKTKRQQDKTSTLQNVDYKKTSTRYKQKFCTGIEKKKKKKHSQSIHEAVSWCSQREKHKAYVPGTVLYIVVII
jgi:hypothetical protein